MDLDLSDFTERAAATKSKGKKAWEWTPIEGRFRGTILGFDQTLSHTGWVLLDWHQPRYIVRHVGMIDPSTTEKGHLGNLHKAEQVFSKAMEIIAMVKDRGLVVRIAYESPPTGGGRLMRPESSLMAAQSIRIAAHLQGIHDIHQVAPQSMKARFTGERGADKEVVHDVLRREYPEIESTRPNNEHTRDALGIALVAAEKE